MNFTAHPILSCGSPIKRSAIGLVITLVLAMSRVAILGTDTPVVDAPYPPSTHQPNMFMRVAVIREGVVGIGTWIEGR